MSELPFWKEQPKPPKYDFRMYSLLVPACASAIGFFAFSVLAFGFAELDTLPGNFRTALVLVGAFSLAFGGEIGTLAAVVEIFRKNGQAQIWDWVGLAVSVLSTLSAFVLAFAALLGVRATWGPAVKMYGPIALGILSALDAYAGFMELGLYLSSYDARVQDWQDLYERYTKRDFDAERRAKRNQTERKPIQKPSTLRTGKPTIDWWRSTYEQMNGNRAQMTPERVQKIVQAEWEIVPSRTTLYNWATECVQSIDKDSTA